MGLLQSQIDRQIGKHKEWYSIHYPLCGFCGHLFKPKDIVDLAHFIRRSSSRELQTVKLNCCLAHRDCHDIYDNSPDQAIYLPRFFEVMYIVWLLDRQYFSRVSGNYADLQDVFAKFPDVEEGEISHHGELVQLHYLL